MMKGKKEGGVFLDINKVSGGKTLDIYSSNNNVTHNYNIKNGYMVIK